MGKYYKIKAHTAACNRWAWKDGKCDCGFSELEALRPRVTALRAENEALKSDNESTNALWSEALELLGEKVQENEALKEDVANRQDLLTKAIRLRDEAYTKNYVKDAQIRMLVEALEKYSDENNFSITVWEKGDKSKSCWLEPGSEHGLIEIVGPHFHQDFGLWAEEALAIIPAEALELAKLEREVVEATCLWSTNTTNSAYQWNMIGRVQALEAYKNK